MTRLFCKDINQLPDRETIERLCKDGEHLVLKFPKNIAKKKEIVITFLKSQLPENFSVFNSGGDNESEWVTIKPVIGRRIIDENETLIRESISDYINLCNELIKDFGTNPKTSEEWDTFRHGEHIRFTNKNSGQIVEVPVFGISRINEVDPYFWGEFIESTEKYNAINNLIQHTFHDSARILDNLMMKDSLQKEDD